MIEEEVKNNKFMMTKSFQDAKEKLQKNHVVIIKGNTGDGKTATAVQLIHLLCKEQQGRQPVELHNIEHLDFLPIKSQLITFIDDIFGEKVVCESDVVEWNKRIKSILPMLRGDKDTEANFLLITIRNEVFNSLKKCSLEKIFTEFNITDLSSNNYKVKEEKEELLELYKPKTDGFSWSEKEKEEIVKCAPGIGFPQCCRLFRDIPDLQEKRVEFFKFPFLFLKEALSKLTECTALLFLFLSEGEIKVKDLEPNGEKVSKILLEQSFKVDLLGVKDDKSMWSYEKKIGFVQQNLEAFLGSLVVKEKHWSGDDVYRFYHDSIHATVALLYGAKSPKGYIEHCPRNSLRYITTSKRLSDRIVISPEKYTYMYERLHREFECEDKYGAFIDSLDVWTDGEFLRGFVRWLSEENVDKLDVLNKACSSGAEKIALHLLTEGVKPDMNTPLWSLIKRRCYVDGEYVDVLKKVVVYLNDEIKLDLLNIACCSGLGVCSKYLLSEEVGCEENTPFCAVKQKSVNVLKNIASGLNDEIKLAVLNVSCYTGSEECATYILSKGVKPDWNTWNCGSRGGSVNIRAKLGECIVDLEKMGDNLPLSHNNALYHACWCEREKEVEILCETYPHLIDDTDQVGLTPLFVGAETGNLGIFHRVERFILKSLQRDEVEHHQCESVDGRVVHKNCVCSQYMSQKVDIEGETVLHASCRNGHMEICKY
ncbi:uncharacterized protein LOC110457555, partial [Mizuhopecten yessoensis]|uniref:uncharacterized protein LOC110457555 n=1 Tax=Mizuhopecten yessoensis TaxID=6573 RepID=UPI000B457FAC